MRARSAIQMQMLRPGTLREFDSGKRYDSETTGFP